jgi:ABC-type polysaccharide/polyol phosphate transport system ATPase subunit
MSVAVRVQDVSKRYRKHRRRGISTLKTAFVRALARLGRVAPAGGDESGFYALKDVSLEFGHGETVGIIGRNGSGKSTLLKILAGIVKPTCGRVQVDGKLSALIELGAGFHPEISGRENIFINGIILGLSKAELRARFDEIVSFAGLEEFIDAPVRTYSSGMYVRLGFSIAIHVNPDVLLIDEILAVGDEKFAHKCLDKMAEFRKSGKTIVLVSHNLSQIEKFCDRAVWIEKGRVANDGGPRRVIDDYLAHIAREEEELYAVLTASDRLEERKSEAKRWGSRKVELTSVHLLDRDGAERHMFVAGEPLAIEMEFHAREEVKEPVFGIAIYRSDGLLCFGTNTHIERRPIDLIRGCGLLRVEVESLGLVEGNYFLDVAVHKDDGTPYDYHHRSYRFGVRSPIRDIGVFRPAHRWHLTSEAAPGGNELRSRDEL